MSPRGFAVALVALGVAALPVVASAEAGSLMGGGFLGASRGALVGSGGTALIQARAEAPPDAARGAGSLFAGPAIGMFAPVAPRLQQTGRAGPSLNVLVGPAGANAGDTAMILNLISAAESGKDGYDAVQYGATRRPARLPTQMTLAEIYGWIGATPGQPHAIGRYQFIPSTLRRLVRELGVGTHEMFSPQMQDRLADLLLEEAGLSAFRSGRMTRQGFMNNLAKIWAGLPNSSGRSQYHGFAGNRATMSWATFDDEMGRIFPG